MRFTWLSPKRGVGLDVKFPNTIQGGKGWSAADNTAHQRLVASFVNECTLRERPHRRHA
jgi:hypothetical protein